MVSQASRHSRRMVTSDRQATSHRHQRPSDVSAEKGSSNKWKPWGLTILVGFQILADLTEMSIASCVTWPGKRATRNRTERLATSLAILPGVIHCRWCPALSISQLGGRSRCSLEASEFRSDVRL